MTESVVNGSTIVTPCSDALVVPDYLDEQLLLKALASGLQVPRAKIVSKQITRATANGDNYMSDVFRIVVHFINEDDLPVSAGSQTVSLVVKCLPNSGQRGPIIDEMRVFEKEVTMFQQIVPKLSAMVGGGELFTAKCYYATTTPERMILFQDLKTLGFVTANRHAGLDYDHCELVMRKIGQFHAASMRFAEQQPEVLREKFNFNLFNPSYDTPNGQIEAVFHNGLMSLIQVAKTQWQGFDQTIIAKLERLGPVYVDKLRHCLEQDSEADGGYRVLNHGDLWSNNMLFKYDGTSHKVQDVVFVDLQISFYSSPGVDLNYALSNCPNYETRARLDELIAVYYRSFSSTLEQLNYPSIPSLEQVKREIRRLEFFSLVCIVSILPIVLMDKTEELVADFDSLVDETKSQKAREIQYNGANYQRIVRPMLEEFNRRQLLDF
ncbi:Juvenile hormone-inducible protein [Anopheles darlingi]|uniref:Juvenile hormone-inducible protein n=1 Tax=Anopheles darlingi TaxID=43151 RepID=W5JP70_ANODA|nr:Juvenile hormone-inducible protein [Anopheles darlingi]